MSDIQIQHPAKHWWIRQPVETELVAKCGSAEITVRIEDGLTDIGYLDEQESRPQATRSALADWAKLLEWAAAQDWPNWEAP